MLFYLCIYIHCFINLGVGNFSNNMKIIYNDVNNEIWTQIFFGSITSQKPMLILSLVFNLIIENIKDNISIWIPFVLFRCWIFLCHILTLQTIEALKEWIFLSYCIWLLDIYSFWIRLKSRMLYSEENIAKNH